MSEKDFGRRVGNQIRQGRDVSSLVFVHLAENEAFDDVTITEHADVFIEWAAGLSVAAGGLYRYNGDVYRVIQAHTTQSDWPPDSTASLWKLVGDVTVEYPDWSQPVGAHDAYQTGDKVTHNGKKWESTAANNVWAPGVYGWTEVTA